MRIVYQIERDGKTIPHVTLYGTLAPGAQTLFAPREVALDRLLRPRQGELRVGSTSPQPLDLYLGVPVTVSIDSVSLASGRFIGADTQAFFSRLVENDARQKSFFADLAA